MTRLPERVIDLPITSSKLGLKSLSDMPLLLRACKSAKGGCMNTASKLRLPSLRN